MPAIPLTVDIQNRVLVGSALPALVYLDDYLELAISPVVPGASVGFYTPVDLTGNTITAQIGAVQGRPSSGIFTLTDPGAAQTSQPIPAGAVNTTVEMAIESRLTLNWPEAWVRGPKGGPWSVNSVTNGARQLLTGTSLSLEPGTEIKITDLQAGSDSQPEIQFIELIAKPLAVSDNFTVSSDSPYVASGAITLSGPGMTQMLSGCLSNTFSLQVLSVDASNNQQTLLQIPIVIAATLPSS